MDKARCSSQSNGTVTQFPVHCSVSPKAQHPASNLYRRIPSSARSDIRLTRMLNKQTTCPQFLFQCNRSNFLRRVAKYKICSVGTDAAVLMYFAQPRSSLKMQKSVMEGDTTLGKRSSTNHIPAHCIEASANSSTFVLHLL